MLWIYAKYFIKIFVVFNRNIFLLIIFRHLLACFLSNFLFLWLFLLCCFHFFDASPPYWLSSTLVPRVQMFRPNFETLIYIVIIKHCENWEFFVHNLWKYFIQFVCHFENIQIGTKDVILGESYRHCCIWGPWKPRCRHHN